MERQSIEKAYARIGACTPLLTDCGALCGAACCKADQDGQGGVFLFPGEEALFAGERWAAVADVGAFAKVLTCGGVCPRKMRPLGCRIFPLTPVKGEKGWTVRVDRRARAMCPLAKNGLRALSREFVRAARMAVREIAKSPAGEAFLEKWQAVEQEFRNAVL